MFKQIQHKNTAKLWVRLLSCSLILITLIGILPSFAYASETTNTDMKISDNGIAVIKYLEGFLKYPVWDYLQYSVGYGTRCPDEDLERYRRDGITEEEAEGLLREALDRFEKHVNKFIDKYNLNLTQNQFDALVSFTYNCGEAWLYSEQGMMAQAVINGYDEDDFLISLIQWCRAGGSVQNGLLKRRLIEFNMYCNNIYSLVPAPHYGYVIYDNKNAVYEPLNAIITVQGYNAAELNDKMPVLTSSDSRFLGWYTAANGGKWIDVLDDSTKGLTLYPHWQGKNTSENAAFYTRITTKIVKVYSRHSVSSSVYYSINKDATITIVADYMDENNIKWGKLSGGGWVKLSDTKPEISYAEAPSYYGTSVTVTTDVLNVRSDAGIHNPKTGWAYKDDVLFIMETKVVNNFVWGRFSDGWCSLIYTDYQETSEPVLCTGRICANESYVNIRADAGTIHEIVARLLPNTPINLYEFKDYKGQTWGRTDLGWVSMALVTKDTADEQTPPIVDDNVDSDEETPDEKPSDKEPNVAMVGVITVDVLRIRAGAGTNFNVVGYLNKNDMVSIIEIVDTTKGAWGKIADGWISMDYVQLLLEDSDNSQPEETIPVRTGVVTTTSLNIRSGAGTNNPKVGSYNKNDNVCILEFKMVGKTVWGKTDKGWISLDYVKMDVANNGAIAIVTTAYLNVRSDAGTHNSIVGKYGLGEIVTILATKTVNKTIWGKTDKGWISLDYVL